MLHFGVTVPATVPQRSEIPEGLMNYPVFKVVRVNKIQLIFYIFKGLMGNSVKVMYEIPS